MGSLALDFRFALRRLRRRPGFAAAAIATIAIGLAAAAALFAVVDGVLLRPLPFRDPARLVAIWQTAPDWKKNPVLAATWDRVPVSLPEYRALSAAPSVFDDVALWSEERLPLLSDGRMEYVRVTKASWTMLRLLGVSPTLGRYFLPDEDRPNGQPVVVLSDETWRDRYGGARDIIGRTVQLDHLPFQVIGVLPPGLSLDRQADARAVGAGGAPTSEFWIPASRDSTEFGDATRENYQLLARLKVGVSMAWATQVADNLLHHTARDGQTWGTRLVPWQVDQTRAVRAPLLILLTAACFLLLIAATNVALLTLGESAIRQHEIALRVAIGARRARLARQLLAESGAVCVAGAALALPLAWLGTKLLVTAAPLPLAAMAAIHPDLRVLAFGLGAISLCTLVAGVTPALTLSGVAPATAINIGGPRTTGRRQPVQRFMVALQVAVSTVLLIGAALLVRTSSLIAHIDPGFDPANLLVVQLLVPREMWGDTLGTRLMYADLFARLRALPGVAAATGTSQPPMVGASSMTRLKLAGEPRSTVHAVQYRAVTPRYFHTMGIRTWGGRDFTDADRSGAEPVAIVSSALARRDFPGRSPLGHRVQLFGAWRTIIGVVGDVHFTRLSSAVEPTIYIPFAQSRSWQLALVIRTRGDPARVTGVVRNAVHEQAPTVGVQRIDVMPSAIRRTFAEERYRAMLMSLFSLIATFLAAIGTYGVTARSVRNRYHEAAIRLSLGASSARVMRLLMGTTASGLVWGAAGGVLMARLVEPWLRPYLFQVSPTDPGVYGTILLGLALLCVGTSWLAARGIAHVHLATVLRSE